MRVQQYGRPVSLHLTDARRMKLQVIATGYDCDIAALVDVAVDELIAAHAQKAAVAVVEEPPVVAARPAARTYAPKPCADCATEFTPAGPRSKYCGRCRGEVQAPRVPPAPAPDMDVVWNGEMGRQGKSLAGR